MDVIPRRHPITASGQGASNLRVLAEALPAMIRAMAEPGGREPEARLGKISHRVAEHLGAEICSIFLLTQSSDEHNQKLVLEESYGYQTEAIGKEKSLQRGLTARILKTPAEIVANFNVQDFPNWSGELDPELQWHCWCMLGVPIVGNNGVVKGVVKVENKRRHRSSPDRVSFIRKPGAKNTPQEIAKAVEEIARQAATDAMAEKSAFLSLEQLCKLTKNFEDVSRQLSAEFPRDTAGLLAEDAVDGFSDQLNPDILDEKLDSVAWYADAIVVQLHRLASLNKSLDDDISDALSLLEAFSLSLSAYSPFSTEDLYLMRTVAAMIAAALDIREAAHMEAFHTLEHAVRRPGSNLLKIVSQLSEKSSEPKGFLDKELLDKLYTMALYISGPQALLQGWWSEQLRLNDFEAIGSIFDRFLESRCLYYHGFAQLKGKQFSFPGDQSTIPDEIRSAEVVNNPEVIVGALDILLVNAVEHGGENIRCVIKRDGDHIEIVIADNGNGVSEDVMKELAEFAVPFSGDLYSPRKGVGLKFASKALAEARMGLQLSNIRDVGGGISGFQAAIRIPLR